METVPNFEDAVRLSDECFEKYMESTSYCDRDKKRCNCQRPNPCIGIQDVIQSIALAEAALAHVLNAEGEKLQKAVQLACNVDDLLKIDASVRSTLIHAAFLEQTLFTKLETVLSEC
ncbi:MAG: hypothetical protein ACOYBE_06305 [Blautia sp.]|jgi:hypothetical protein